MRVPSNSPITLPFGSTDAPYNAGSPHKGTDFAYEPDNVIYAPFTGRVNLVPNNGRDGNGVYMTDPEGRLHGMLHTSKYLVSNGSTVMEGQPIAIMGDTGYAFGVHLHWCVKENGVFIDPLSLVKPSQETQDMATNAQIDEIIATAHQGVFGTPAPDVDFNNLRPLLSANLAEGVLEMLKQYNNNADAAYKQTSSKYEQITDPVYRKKTK